MSNINFTNINENFPVAGQDNDTQVFRDNFDSIKTGLRIANEEITDLQDNVARRDQSNDFNGNIITNAQLINNTDVVSPQGTLPSTVGTIDFENGNYQTFILSNTSFKFDFLNFPANGLKVGKVTVELYGIDNTSRNVSFQLSDSSSIKSNGFPVVVDGIPTLTLTSSTDPVIFEVWRHSESRYLMRYIGTFA